MPPILWIAGGAALWGTDTVLRKPLAGVLGSTQIVLYEHLILSLIVLPIVIYNRSYLGKISPMVWAAIFGTAWIGSALATVLFTSAIRSGSPTTAVLLQKVQPIFAIALSRVVLREKWPSSFPLIAVLAIGGAYFVAFGTGSPFEAVTLWPALLALAAAAGWASATIWGRIAAREVPFELVTALRFLCALPALGIAAVIQGQTAAPTGSQLMSIVWMALIPGFIALMLYYRGLRQTPASQATIAELAFPASAALLNWLALGVSPSPLQIAGFAVVWFSIFQLSRRNYAV